eukprot:gene23933-31063_t
MAGGDDRINELDERVLDDDIVAVDKEELYIRWAPERRHPRMREGVKGAYIAPSYRSCAILSGLPNAVAAVEVVYRAGNSAPWNLRRTCDCDGERWRLNHRPGGNRWLGGLPVHGQEILDLGGAGEEFGFTRRKKGRFSLEGRGTGAPDPSVMRSLM